MRPGLASAQRGSASATVRSGSVVMAQQQVLDSFAALLRNASMRTPFDQIDICIAGMTDLCAPEFDDRFDARLPVREAAKHLARANSKQAICIFYLDHLLRGHEMRAVEDHALDGACLLNTCSYENTFDVLHDVSLALLAATILWLRHLAEEEKAVRQVTLFVVCSTGKHSSVFCGRVLSVMLNVVLKCANWNTRIETVWSAGPRCEREAIMHNAFGRKSENKTSITECRHSPIVIKKCHDMFVTHMAKRNVPFLTVKVDDALYEECSCKAFVDAQNVLAVGTSEFLLCRFLAVAKVNLTTSLHELVPARNDMWFTKFMASDACGHAWHLLMQSYMMELWPKACSLCCRSQQTCYAYQHNVDTFFASLWSKEAECVQKSVSGLATAAPKGHSRRQTWADMSEEDGGDDFAAATELWASAPGTDARTASVRAGFCGEAATKMNQGGTVPIAAAGAASVRTGSCKQAPQKTKPLKKVTFAEADADVTLIESTRKVWMLTVDERASCIVNYDDECLGSIADRDDIGVVLVDDVARSKEFMISRGDKSIVLNRAANELFTDFDFVCEFELCIQNMEQVDTMPIEDLSKRSHLGQIQYIMFYHLYAVATLGTQDLGVHATGQFLSYAGMAFYEASNIDMLELIHKYLFYVWLASGATLDSSLLTLFVPRCAGGDLWWREQQQHVSAIARSAFAREYACLVQCPFQTDQESQKLYKRELRLIKQQKETTDIKTVPDMPAFEYWFQHNAAVLAEDALPSPRPLPPFRGSAPAAQGSWGNGDGMRGEVTRSNVIAEPHVFLEVDCSLPPVSLQDVLGENFLQQFLQEVTASNLWAPAWLTQACGSAAHDPVDLCAFGSAANACSDAPSETMLWFPQLIYQALGLALLQAMRPDTVAHPHLRAQFDLHMGIFLAMEIKLRRLTLPLQTFMCGNGIRFHRSPATDHWITTMLERRKPAGTTRHGLKVHSLWGEKLRAQ